jgi:hypothetical protein
VTVRSTAIAAVNFFSGFTRVTETLFEAEYKSAVANVRTFSSRRPQHLSLPGHSGLDRNYLKRVTALTRLNRNTISVHRIFKDFCSDCGPAQIPSILVRGKGSDIIS